MTPQDIILSDDELQRIAAYSQPAKMLAELRRQGFYRARRSPLTGKVILERAHFESVCASRDALKPGPKLRLATR